MAITDPGQHKARSLMKWRVPLALNKAVKRMGFETRTVYLLGDRDD